MSDKPLEIIGEVATASDVDTWADDFAAWLRGRGETFEGGIIDTSEAIMDTTELQQAFKAAALQHWFTRTGSWNPHRKDDPMQEFRRDGTDALTENATLEDIRKALENPENEKVVLHKAGSKIERWKDGRRRVYEVQEDGSLVELGGDALR